MRTLALTLAVLAAAPSSAAAQVHGRFDGDLSLEAGLGGGVVIGETDEVIGAAVLDLRARYLDMAGLIVGAEVRPDGSHRVHLGADLRPLFMARFVLGASFHDRYWDRLVDSIGIDLGVALTPLDETVGAALMFGFGVDVPLVFFDDDGPAGLALRLFGRHVAAQGSDRFGPTDAAHDWVFGATLVVRGMVATGAPGVEPRRYELPER